MKALTLWQPWAHAIAHLDKRIENRTWAPATAMLDQPLAIHAGKTVDEGAVEDLVLAGLLSSDFNPDDLVLGAVVAVATLWGWCSTIDRVQGDQRIWWGGPCGWVLKDVQTIEPVTCRGMQGLWELPAEVESRVRAELAKNG